jgi:hypothetical protein
MRNRRMPHPISSRVLWDRWQLDEAFTALASELEDVWGDPARQTLDRSIGIWQMPYDAILGFLSLSLSFP